MTANLDVDMQTALQTTTTHLDTKTTAARQRASCDSNASQPTQFLSEYPRYRLWQLRACNALIRSFVPAPSFPTSSSSIGIGISTSSAGTSTSTGQTDRTDLPWRTGRTCPDGLDGPPLTDWMDLPLRVGRLSLFPFLRCSDSIFWWNSGEILVKLR